MYIYEKVTLDYDLPIKLNPIAVTEENFKTFHQYTYAIEKHWHRSIEILIPLEGELTVWILGNITTIKPGDFYIINTEEIHSVYGNQIIYKGYVLQISYDYLLKCFPNMDTIYFQQLTNKEIKETLLKYVKDINEAYNNTSKHKTLKILSLLQMLVYILLQYQSKQREDMRFSVEDKYKNRVIEIIDYIDTHYKEDLSVNKLAEYFNLSYGHLSRIFRDSLKMTVKEYITIVRLKHCKNLLKNTDCSITEISFENGFPNIQSFYKEFKKHYKCTPLTFRNNVIK